MKAFFLVIFATILTSIAQLLYKSGANDFFSWPVILGFVIYCLAAILIILALKSADLSVVFPVLSTSFIWVSVLSVFFFNEVLSVVNWSGLVLIVLGVMLLGKGAK